jgi:hypothetical protein
MDSFQIVALDLRMESEMKNALNGLFVITVFALCAPSLSWACSPPIYPLEIGAAVGNPDGVAFTVIDDGWGGAITAELTLGGETIPGTTEAVRDTSYHIFRPAEPLAEGDYELSVSNENSSDGAEVTVGPKLDLNLDIQTEAGIQESILDIVCCPTQEGGCFDSCESCSSCWPSGYKYFREVKVDVSAGQPVVIYVQEVGDPRIQAAINISGSNTFKLRDPALSDDDFCVTVVVNDLAMNELDSREVCVAPGEFPEVVERVPDAREEVSQCSGPPNNTEDVNWQRYGEKSGCSSTNSFASFLLLLVAFGFRRSKRM